MQHGISQLLVADATSLPKSGSHAAQKEKLQAELTAVRKEAEQALPVLSLFETRSAKALHQML